MMVSALIEREQGAALPIRNGAFVAVVGPSGAGKDTLIAHARAALADEPQVEFVRRVITRLADGETEDHDTLTDAAFWKRRPAAPSRLPGRRTDCATACQSA